MATTIEPDVRRESAAKTTPAGPPVSSPAEPTRGGRRGTVFMIMGVVLLALVGLGARRWIYGLSHVSTDNAQVDGHIVPILPKVGGFVTEVRIDENQNVKAGDTLVVLDDRDYKVRLAQAGQPLMSVVPLEDVWVTANLKETEVADVKPGEPVDFTVDAYPGTHFRGHVQSLSPATGARFSLLPPDNATGNFTKVVQRIPVRIRVDGTLDPAHPLRPGMSVNATVVTK